MFYAVLKESPPVVAVQPNDPLINARGAADLIQRLEKHFMRAISIVAWDKEGHFLRYGHPVSEGSVTDEDLIWREFDLPPEAEIPF